jgi:hypothetical protein
MMAAVVLLLGSPVAALHRARRHRRNQNEQIYELDIMHGKHFLEILGMIPCFLAFT